MNRVIKVKTHHQENSEYIMVGAREFKGAFAYYAYTQCPRRKPRNIDVVMDKLESIIESEFTKVPNSTYCYMEFQNHNELYEWLDKKLKSIPEFVDWNLSENELAEGISVDDENRPPFRFTSAYDVEDDDYIKNDFVDLDAFISNVMFMIINLCTPKAEI